MTDTDQKTDCACHKVAPAADAPTQGLPRRNLLLKVGAGLNGIAAALLDEGIFVSTAEPFATTTHVPHAIRLALGSVSHERLRAALQVVKARVEEQTY